MEQNARQFAGRQSSGYDDEPPPEDPAGEFERTPPQDVMAEQCVLGGMLLSKDAIADVVEILKANDFYKPAHSTIFDAICDKYARGEPADAITLAATLNDMGELGRIGGAPYLHTLISSVPTAANASYYARIVSERAILRRLIEAGTRVVQLGYGTAAGGGRDVDDLVDLAQQAVYDVTERRVSEDFAQLSDLLQPTLDEIEAVGEAAGAMTGVPTGFADLDRLLNGLQAGQLVIVAGRPGLGKSTVAMDFLRHSALHHQQAAAIFSLEMSKVEIVMRLLAAETRVPLHVLRSGQLSDDDWTRLARRMGEISEAPLFIDDTPSMTLMEIRAKARRLKQRHNLKLLVIDYLQLMTSPKRVESRQQEVSELSRGMKLLAKEVDCPVIAVAQLNRGPEQRTDKRPQLSDLRESGCVTASTRLLRADTNAEITIGELMTEETRDIPVWAMDERMRMVPRTLTHAFSSGRKETFRVRLTSGKTIEATANHPFLTIDGWTPLGELRPGSRVATPRVIPEPQHTAEMPEAEIILLAHMIGDGSMVKRQPIGYASVDEQNLKAVTQAAEHFGVTPIRDDHAAARVTSLRLPAPYPLARGKRNPIAAWLDDLGLFDKRSHQKFIPEPVFSLPKDQVALFLKHLWATDGSVNWIENPGQAKIYYGSTSEKLVEDVAKLLMRFGIQTKVTVTRKSRYREQYNLYIHNGEDQLRWLREIGVHGERAKAALECESKLENKNRMTQKDTVPMQVWNRVRGLLAEREMHPEQLMESVGVRYRGGDTWRRAPSRSRLSKVAEVLGDGDLELLATNDVFWDEIAEIESIGEQDVYDATVLKDHNFIANSICMHNSLEQDADVVLLLHRDDYYDKESPRAGEADFVVAKHRNGATDTITVAAQLHLARFVDIAV